LFTKVKKFFVLLTVSFYSLHSSDRSTSIWVCPIDLYCNVQAMQSAEPAQADKSKFATLSARMSRLNTTQVSQSKRLLICEQQIVQYNWTNLLSSHSLHVDLFYALLICLYCLHVTEVINWNSFEATLSLCIKRCEHLREIFSDIDYG